MLMDKLSRLRTTSKLIKCYSSCGIRSLADGRRMAPILLGRLTLVRFQAIP
jgi:hypothetical protein